MTTAKPSVRTRTLRWKSVVIAGAIGIALPSITSAEDCVDVNIRPLSDFLSAQGSYVNFFPPVPDYVGWAGSDFATFALVDYAGVAAAYLLDEGINLGTEVRGLVAECELLDGSAQVDVALVTDNAMGFAQDIEELIANEFDFAGTPTIFGNKAVDIANGEPAALGSAEVYLSFHMKAPGDPLPDFLDVVNAIGTNGKLTYGPVTLTFTSLTEDGSGNCLTVNQEGVTSPNGKEMLSQEPFLIEEVFVAPCPSTD